MRREATIEDDGRLGPPVDCWRDIRGEGRDGELSTDIEVVTVWSRAKEGKRGSGELQLVLSTTSYPLNCNRSDMPSIEEIFDEWVLETLLHAPLSSD